MTETTLPKTTTIRFADSDHRAELAAAMRLAETTVARVPADAVRRATPCAGLDVAQIIGHLGFVPLRLEAMYTGQPAAFLDPWDRLAVPPAEAARQLAARNARVLELLADDAVLDRVIVPWRPMTVRESLPCYVSEYTVHTWDLARACNLPVDWDPAVVELSYEAMVCEIPAEHRAAIFAAALADAPEGVEVPFAEAQPAPAGASAADRLAAYVGRRVAG